MGLQSQADAYKNSTRKSPKFSHLPEQRARKLKKAWVDKQKMKSKWKATKRKEGLGGVVPITNDSPEDNDDAASKDGSGLVDDADMSDSKPLSSRRTKAPSFQSPIPKQAHDQPDLRELRRQAYAPESLHTHKSDPLHRRRGDAGRGRGRGAPSSRGRNGPGQGHDRQERGGRGREPISSSARGHVRTSAPERGRIARGQPNMRLRMNAMLEQIKRDDA